jgi:hypothetical protein
VCSSDLSERYHYVTWRVAIDAISARLAALCR